MNGPCAHLSAARSSLGIGGFHPCRGATSAEWSELQWGLAAEHAALRMLRLRGWVLEYYYDLHLGQARLLIADIDQR